MSSVASAAAQPPAGDEPRAPPSDAGACGAAPAVPSPAWDPAASRAAQAWPAAAFFWLVSFGVAHLFLFPLLAGALVWAAVRAGGPPAAAAAALAAAAYARSYAGGAERDGRRLWPAFCVPWVGCHPYFPVRLLMWDGVARAWADGPTPGHAATLPLAARTHIFAMFPHGPLPLGAAMLRPQIARWPWLSERLRMGAADAVFWLPIVRDFYLWWGGVAADKRCLTALLARGTSVLLLPGGISEQLVVPVRGEDVVVLQSRKGFVRLALETGSPLVPVYCFGERRAYVTQSATSCASTFLKRLCRVGVPIVRGRFFTLMPLSTPITIVIGKPIDVPMTWCATRGGGGGGQTEAASASAGGGAGSMPAAASGAEFDAAVDALHAQFIAALRDLYETHKGTSGFADTALVIR